MQGIEKEQRDPITDIANQSIRYPSDSVYGQSLGSRQQQVRMHQIQQQEKVKGEQ